MDIAEARGKIAADKGAAVQLRQRCSKRKAALIQRQDDWKTEWRQVSEYVDPSRGRFDGDKREGGSKKGNRRRKIINSLATGCLRVATAGMSSHMTSKSRPWFALATPDPTMSGMHDVRVWLDEVTDLIRDTLAKSNFYKAMPVVYAEDMLFGVAVMLIAENADEVVRFHPLTCGTYAIGLDEAGRVDTLWRSYQLSARQIVQRHGKMAEGGKMVPDPSKMPRAVIESFARGGDDMFTVEALIEPNPDVRAGLGPLGLQAPQFRPWREVVWIDGQGGHGPLEQGGHYEAPFVALRFNPVGDDVYSTSPGIDCLGDIKQLQYLEGQKLRLVDLLADPPISAPDTMQTIGLSLMPGARNYMPQSEAGVSVAPTYTPRADALQAVMAEIETVSNRIREAFFYNLFMMLDALGDQTGRTATEIAQRTEEKAQVLGPTLEITTDEGLDPTVVRVYRMLERAGMIPPAPEMLQSVPLKIEYTSILAQAMKASGTMSIERSAAFVGQMASLFGQSALDKFDVDAAVDEYTERAGSPARIMRSEEAVQGIRAGRAQQEQMAQLAQMAEPMQKAASAYKSFTDASGGPGAMQAAAGVAP